MCGGKTFEKETTFFHSSKGLRERSNGAPGMGVESTSWAAVEGLRAIVSCC